MNGRWVFIPAPEEIPVTFQIGMVGEDGVLLASDTLVTQGSELFGSAVRSTYHTPKIDIYENDGVAFCWAGDVLTGIVARGISKALTETSHLDLKSFLWQSAGEALKKAYEAGSATPNSPFTGGDILMVFRAADSVQLWKLHIQPPIREPLIMPEKMTKHVCTGDQASPAVFFTERYFPADRKLPIRDLIPLAAHTVLMASKFSAGIGGLQIVLCRPSGFELLDGEEISILGVRSQKIDFGLADSLGLPLP